MGVMKIVWKCWYSQSYQVKYGEFQNETEFRKLFDTLLLWCQNPTSLTCSTLLKYNNMYRYAIEFKLTWSNILICCSCFFSLLFLWGFPAGKEPPISMNLYRFVSVVWVAAVAVSGRGRPATSKRKTSATAQSAPRKRQPAKKMVASRWILGGVSSARNRMWPRVRCN